MTRVGEQGVRRRLALWRVGVEGQSEPGVSPAVETYRLYWQVQCDRVAQHENGRYQVSAHVLAGSLVALGFITQSRVDSGSLWIATVGVASVNLLAMVFIAGERRWVKVHLARAADALQVIAPDLAELQKVGNRKSGFAPNSSHRNALARSANLLASMHMVVGLATVLIDSALRPRFTRRAAGIGSAAAFRSSTSTRQTAAAVPSSRIECRSRTSPPQGPSALCCRYGDRGGSPTQYRGSSHAESRRVAGLEASPRSDAPRRTALAHQRVASISAVHDSR